jgi:hypothetical protein
MPAVVVAAAITGAAGVGTGVMSAKAQSGAAKRASASQARSEDAQLAYMRDKDAREEKIAADRAAIEQKNYDAQQAFQQKQWEAQEEERLYKRRLFEEDRAADLAERQSADERRAQEAASYVAPPPDPYVQNRKSLRDQALGKVQQLLNQQNPYAPRPVGYAFTPPPSQQGMTAAQLLQQGRG